MNAYRIRKYSGHGDAHGESGVALVLALLFIVLLTVLVADFVYEMKVDASLIDAQNSDMEAYLSAKSGVATAMATLARDLILSEDDAVANNNTGIFDSLDEPWAEPSALESLNNALGTFLIADEYGKINLNALIFDNDIPFQPLVDALEYLFTIREVEVSPVDAILDWIDTNDFSGPNGYENDFYENLKVPYSCKNGPMDSLEELLLIPGITLEVFFGDPELGQVPLTDLLTVHGHPQGKININTAELDTLESMFAASQLVSDPLAQAEDVHARVREGEPFFSIQEVESAGFIKPAPVKMPETKPEATEVPPTPNLFDVVSSVFRIQSDGQAGGDTSLRIEAYVWRDTPSQSGEVVGDSQMFRILEWKVIR